MLLKALAEEMPRVEIFFLRLLLTGARRDEARLMQWKHRLSSRVASRRGPAPSTARITLTAVIDQHIGVAGFADGLSHHLHRLASHLR